MFEGWADYYLLVGSAAAALVGLLFVVVTLTSGLQSATAERGARFYMTPIVFQLAIVLVLSGLAMAPELSPATVALTTAGVALVAGAYTGWIAWSFARGQVIHVPHWSDRWCYGFIPFVLYLLLAAIAAGFWCGFESAAVGLALFAIGSLLLAIRNAWDLVTWIAPRAGTPEGQAQLNDG
jgi:hypothetical protein